MNVDPPHPAATVRRAEEAVDGSSGPHAHHDHTHPVRASNHTEATGRMGRVAKRSRHSDGEERARGWRTITLFAHFILPPHHPSLKTSFKALKHP